MRHTWGTANSHSGTYAYVISNHVYGFLLSDPMTVAPDSVYELYAWLQGKLDPGESFLCSGTASRRATFGLG